MHGRVTPQSDRHGEPSVCVGISWPSLNLEKGDEQTLRGRQVPLLTLQGCASLHVLWEEGTEEEEISDPKEKNTKLCQGCRIGECMCGGVERG